VRLTIKRHTSGIGLHGLAGATGLGLAVFANFRDKVDLYL